MSTRSEVLLWAQRVIARKGQPAYVLLELKVDATAEQAQAAFHKIARTAHPDLHRQGLTQEEIEMVTSAYAAVAGAYQEMRTKTMATTRIKPIGKDGPPLAPGTESLHPATSPPTVSRTMTPPSSPAVSRTPTGARPPLSRPEPARPSAPVQRPSAATPPAGTPSAAAGGANAPGAMSPKALIYYRKAEIALNKGDLKGAILQLKLAVATDPSSSFLRSALAEVETEVRKTV